MIEVPLTKQEIAALLDLLRAMMNTFTLDEKQEALAVQIQRKLRRFA